MDLREKGTTLVEIVVVIFIIGIFSAIMISDFPRILKQYALSRTTYRLAQDFRRAQDMGFSGVMVSSLQAKGYGIYADLNNAGQYIIYADRGGAFNSTYDGILQDCQNSLFPDADCILETVLITRENKDLYIKEVKNKDQAYTGVSVNFAPPNPDITITHLAQGQKEMGITLGLRSEPDLERTVWINTSGLIRIE